MIDLQYGDCLDLMKKIEDKSIDLILCDLPYGTTACEWDSIIPLVDLWTQYKRIIKPYHAIVLTASQPFTTVLAMSNMDWLKYEWIWMKNRPTNHAHAKNKPMRKHENVLVFSEGSTVHAAQSAIRMPYYPQDLHYIKTKKIKGRNSSEYTNVFFAKRASHGEFERGATNFPNSILEFSTDQLGLHPTAKPVALMEYLVRSYTEENETVLDNCMGSGTTGVAAVKSNRNFIGMELERPYFEIAKKRIEARNANFDDDFFKTI